jgi:sterol desaturase/sphingolipid hydroxylase (fatty acid hydroxylase superfamily)
MPYLAPGEGKKIVVLALTMCAIAHWRRREMRQRWLGKKGEDDKEAKHAVDHPAVGYLLENAVCLGSAALIDNYFPVVDKNRPAYSVVLILLRGFFMVNPTLLFEKFAATTLYSHVPYFSAKKPAQDLMNVIRDYFRCNFAVDMFNTVFQIGILLRMNDTQINEIVKNPPALKLVPYMAKFMICRVVVDVTFGLAHRLMHENQWLYDNIHRVHHEHSTPRTQTNLHFTWIDQYIEAVFPIYVAFGTLSAVGLVPNRYEQTLLAAHLLYFESCSHTGKEIPIVTWVPFLSPLVDWFTGCDQRLIEYHTRHHQLYRCNYSISPWWDKLLGTYRIDLPQEYNKQGSLE